jgi:hypothetical protein
VRASLRAFELSTTPHAFFLVCGAAELAARNPDRLAQFDECFHRMQQYKYCSPSIVRGPSALRFVSVVRAVLISSSFFVLRSSSAAVALESSLLELAAKVASPFPAHTGRCGLSALVSGGLLAPQLHVHAGDHSVPSAPDQLAARVQRRDRCASTEDR